MLRHQSDDSRRIDRDALGRFGGDRKFETGSSAGNSLRMGPFGGQASHGTDFRMFPMPSIGEKPDAVNRPRLKS